MLRDFIILHRLQIVARCRQKFAARATSRAAEDALVEGVPLFLDQLAQALAQAGGDGCRAVDESADQRGHDLLLQGFTVSQVVHAYGDICQAITEAAMEMNAPIGVEEFGRLNCCLDEAIAAAVTSHALESQRRAALRQHDAARRSRRRIGLVIHELRNLVNTAIVAFEVLKTGNVGLSSSTGAVLNRSLIGLRDLIAHSLDEVRATKGATNRTRIGVPAFIEEVAAAAALSASVRDVTLSVARVDDDLAVDADQRILAAVVTNLLQNAFKFTRPRTTVMLRARGGPERVLIEVEDQCGGLAGASGAQELPAAFEQRSADRSGLGIGLAFSRWGAEINGGRLYARNLPNRGCIFTVDLPRAPAEMATSA